MVKDYIPSIGDILLFNNPSFKHIVQKVGGPCRECQVVGCLALSVGAIRLSTGKELAGWVEDRVCLSTVIRVLEKAQKPIITSNLQAIWKF